MVVDACNHKKQLESFPMNTIKLDIYNTKVDCNGKVAQVIEIERAVFVQMCVCVFEIFDGLLIDHTIITFVNIL